MYRHCEELISVLQRVADGELKRVMVFMPPRHSKSETVSRLFPAYYLQRYPERSVGLTSYSIDLARTLSRAARSNFIEAGGELSKTATAVTHWETKQGGAMWSAGVGGAITGKGGHLLIVDDPVKNAADADSEQLREKVKDWYDSTFYTRLEPEGAIVIVQTRWHEDDLSGWLLSQEGDEEEDAEGWYIVNLPGLAEEPVAFPSSCTVHPDWREVGEALCEERYPKARLARVARKIGEYWFNALFQQRPRAREGNIFKRIWFESRYKSLPDFKAVYTMWDTALKAQEKNDETACAVWGEGVDGLLYLLRVAHGRWETPDVADFLIEQAYWLRELYGDLYVGDFVEDKVSGTTLMQYLRRHEDPDTERGYDGKRLVVTAVQVEADKVSRAHGVTPLCESERVRLPDSGIFPDTRGWVAKFIDQLLGFPGKHDDMVDVFVYGIKRFMGTLGKKSAKRTKAKGYV